MSNLVGLLLPKDRHDLVPSVLGRALGAEGDAVKDHEEAANTHCQLRFAEHRI
jgi:hypothetical protein